MNTNAAMLSLLLAPAALVLDLLLGDPHGWPHPVRLIGTALNALERRFLGHEHFAPYQEVNGSGPSPSMLSEKFLKCAGAITLFCLCGMSWLLVSSLGYMGWAGLLALVYMSYAGLALGCLLREFDRATALVAKGTLDDARRAVSMLVSRDTEYMSRDDLRRSLAETLSENLNDGFVAPYFYLALFGPAALWVYKTVSTMDSMWGYKTPGYISLGCFAARTDDLLAYIPARLSAFFIITTGAAPSKWCVLFRAVSADAQKMSSPNAGWPMAAAAYVTGRSMGGATPYNGLVVQKPELGPRERAWDDLSLSELRRKLLRAGLFSAGFLWSLGLIFHALIP